MVSCSPLPHAMMACEYMHLLTSPAREADAMGVHAPLPCTQGGPTRRIQPMMSTNSGTSYLTGAGWHNPTPADPKLNSGDGRPFGLPPASRMVTIERLDTRASEKTELPEQHNCDQEFAA